MLVDAMVFCNDARKLGIDDIEVSLSMRGYSFGKIQFGIVANFYSQKLSALQNLMFSDIFNPKSETKQLNKEQLGLLQQFRSVNQKTIVKTRNYYEFELFVEECKYAINPFCVRVEIIFPKLNYEDMYPESPQIQSLKYKIKEEKELSKEEGWNSCYDFYRDKFSEVDQKVDKLEQKIKNPMFYEKVRRMNPNGVLKGNEKGKELIKVISEIDVIKRHIRELTKST
jgi:hypothetical protein